MPKQWTESQRRAITLDDRDLCVSAGAGCGKTGTLVERFIGFVSRKSDPLDVKQILAITFTEKASAEMKERVIAGLRRRGMLKESREVEHAHISTIHGFCTRLLKEFPVEAGIDPRFAVQEEIASAIERDLVLDAIFDEGIEAAARFLAAVGEDEARNAIRALYDDYRSRGLDPRAEPLRLAEIAGVGSDVTGPAAAFISLVRSDQKPTASALNKAAELEAALPFLRETDQGVGMSWERVENLRRIRKSLGGQIAEKLKPARAIAQEALDAPIDAFLAKHVEELLGGLGELLKLFSERYETRKQSLGVLDFEDLQLRARDLLRDHPEVREALREQFRQIMVDEFQDTNALQAEIVGLIRGRSNLFVVGDAQQSIYRFRHAEVGIFRDAIRSAKEATPSGFVPMGENFRSRARVVQLTNHLFQQLWAEMPDLFLEIDPRASYADGASGEIELLFLPGDEKRSARDLRTAEANALARKIEQLVESGAKVQDGDALRPARYGDVAILFRVATDVALYEQALLERGVPFYTSAGRGFYQRREIQDLVCFLKAIDNPLENIPLAAVLRSPLVGISDSALLRLARQASKAESPLYAALKARGEIAGIAEADAERLDRFAALLESLREERDRLSVAQILARILSGTNFEARMMAERLGKRKLANVRKLGELARSTAGLHLTIRAFNRFVEDLVTREAREGEARIESERGDVVRLMTIHSAKGLEFPVVIVPDLTRTLTPRSGLLAISPDAKVSIKVTNPISGEQEKPAGFREIAEINAAEERREAERLLYVALTRARERLILSGFAAAKKLPEKSFAGMLAGALGIDKLDECELTLGDSGLCVRLVSAEPGESAAIRPAPRVRLLDCLPEGLPEPDLAAREALLRRVRLPRPEPALPSRFTVTALLTYSNCPKRYDLRYNWRVPEWTSGEGDFDDLDVDENPLPAEHPLSEIQMGLAIHKALEVYRFDGKPDEAVSAALRVLGLVADHEQIGRLVAMLNRAEQSEVARRLRDARWDEREFRFTVRIGDALLVGAMDNFHEDLEGRVGIVDYKTNRVGPDRVDALAAEYQFQTGAYAFAARQLTGKLPSWVSFYFLAPNKIHERIITPEILAEAEARIEIAISGIRSESFPARPGHLCRRCKFNGTVCPEGLTD